MQRRSGFSIIELMVTIAIIMILISFLLPALSEVKTNPLIHKCQINMRNQAVAANAYAMDNKHLVPYPNWRRNDTYGWLYDFNVSDPYRLNDEELGEFMKTGAHWPYINDKEAYRCPVDEPPWPARGPIRKTTSYVMNGAVCGFGRLRGKTYHIESLNPRGILHWEVDEFGGGGWWNDGSSFPWEGITKRHRTGANVSSVDTSAEWISIEEYYEEEKNDPGRLWFNPGTRNGH